MFFFIRTLTSWVLPILDHPDTGTVHSAYGKAVNLVFGSRMVSLQPLGSPVSPLSLITDVNAETFASLPLKAGQPVSILQKGIQIQTDFQEIFFCFSNAEKADTYLTPSISETWTYNIKAALTSGSLGGLRCIFIPDTHPCPQDNNLLVTTTARKILAECKSFWLFSRFNDAATSITRLIGLGIGLTPSGDDFLCGVLAGFILTNHMDHPFFHALRKQIAGNVNRTNTLSAAFLQCALHSHFSLTVKNLCSYTSDTEISSAFSKIGHTSGMDTLSGIYYAICLLKTEPGQ